VLKYTLFDSNIFHLHFHVQILTDSHLPLWFPVELASNCTQGDVAISSGDFGILKNKRSNVDFASKRDLRDSMVTKFITFSPRNHRPHLHFRWSYAITGWTNSQISITSFHLALMALGIRRSTPDNFIGPLRYSRKMSEAVTFVAPPLFEG